MVVRRQLHQDNRRQFELNNNKIVCPECFTNPQTNPSRQWYHVIFKVLASIFDVIPWTKSHSNLAFELPSLAKILSSETTEQIMLAVYDVGSQRGAQECKTRLSKVQNELQTNNSSVGRVRQHIVENILTLRCPYENCRRAFLDYDGCNALQCSTCSGYFCAYCLAKSKTSSKNHRHVEKCPLVPNGEMFVFYNVRLFRDVQRRRRAELVRAYLLAFVEPNLRSKVLDAMTRDLADLSICRRTLQLDPIQSVRERILKQSLRAVSLAAFS
jgi:hypothetical protein